MCLRLSGVCVLVLAYIRGVSIGAIVRSSSFISRVVVVVVVAVSRRALHSQQYSINFMDVLY